jgi:geranylgeranyl diphosphate synthase, type I
MTAVARSLNTLDLVKIRQRIDDALNDFLEKKSRATDSPEQQELIALLREFLDGGKRIRSILCVVGWYAVSGHGHEGPPPMTVFQTAASLELFHAFALIHDDVMDNSTSRRGRPTIHRILTARYAQGREKQAAHLGISGAVLLGDLALVWSDELLNTAGLTPAERARVLPVIDVMRTEVMYGQYLDLVTTGRPTENTARALEIIRYKTAKYTIERPLHLGGALGGADAVIGSKFSEYALPIGEAFQLRDDLLGVFGNSAETGKSVLEDLREGKHTYLMALALRHADPDHRRLLDELVGKPDLDEPDAARIRAVVCATGAPARVEKMISDRRRKALSALAGLLLPPPVMETLQNLATKATARVA